jgi:cobalamin biosynthesis Mg chelatase CobN
VRKNPSLKTAILAAALVVFFALPSVASAGQVVPPGNSAATQYTQVFPTSGGNVSVGSSIGEPSGEKKPPSKVIGKQTTQELESKGSEGKAVAQLAAESAPETTSEPETSEPSEGSSGGGAGGHANGGGSGGGKAGGQPSGASPGGQKPGGAQSGGGAPARNQANGPTSVPTGSTAAAEAAGSGSSGFSEVLGQATGASSGQMGVFLPLVLLAALVLALAYVWWRRQHDQKAAP